MAVSRIEKPQSFLSPMKPSSMPSQHPGWFVDVRRIMQFTLGADTGDVGGAGVLKLVGVSKTPWAGVVERIEAFQEIVDSTAATAPLRIACTIGGTAIYAAAADGDLFDDDATVGTSIYAFPTDDLETCADGETRVKFAKNEAIILTASAPAAAIMGVIRIEIEIAREDPHTL